MDRFNVERTLSDRRLGWSGGSPKGTEGCTKNVATFFPSVTKPRPLGRPCVLILALTRYVIATNDYEKGEEVDTCFSSIGAVWRGSCGCSFVPSFYLQCRVLSLSLPTTR